MNQLAMHVADARVHMRRRARREDFPPGLIHQLGLNRDRPKNTSGREWLLLARDLIEGDQMANSLGFEPMAQPSAADLSKLLNRAEAALKRTDDADCAYQQAQQQQKKVSEELAELILDTAACLRFTLRRKPASQRRRIMRRYGFTFKGDPPEQEKPKQEPTTEQPQSKEEATTPPLTTEGQQTAPVDTKEPPTTQTNTPEPENGVLDTSTDQTNSMVHQNVSIEREVRGERGLGGFGHF